MSFLQLNLLCLQLLDQKNLNLKKFPTAAFSKRFSLKEQFSKTITSILEMASRSTQDVSVGSQSNDNPAQEAQGKLSAWSNCFRTCLIKYGRYFRDFRTSKC